MHGAAPNRVAAVVGTKLHRVPARGDPVVGPVQIRLFRFVGCKILKRPEPRPGIQTDHGEPSLGQPAGERTATRSGAHDQEVMNATPNDGMVQADISSGDAVADWASRLLKS